MRILGIIPSRYASSRFPGKPLADINGMSMIKRVFFQSGKSSILKKVIVATDDDRIYNHVKEFTEDVVMTSSGHESGTDRCAEAVVVEGGQWDAVINIQGDEPFIDPDQIDLVCNTLLAGASIATLIKKISKRQDLFNVNIPKVVVNNSGEALYFSRQPVPFVKGADEDQWTDHATFYKHIGIYGYQTRILKEITALQRSMLEKSESLEQLRWLENGYRIQTAVTELETLAIDTPDDLDKISAFM